MNELNNFEIQDIMDKKNIFIQGVYSKDMLPTILKKGFYVINIQNSNDGGGSHWTCLYYNGDNDNIYFDSFGSPSPLEVQEKLKNYSYNDKQIQNIDSTACGYYCIAFMEYMDRFKNNDIKKTFENFLDIFKTNSKYNDVILKNFVKMRQIKI